MSLLSIDIIRQRKGGYSCCWCCLWLTLFLLFLLLSSLVQVPVFQEAVLEHEALLFPLPPLLKVEVDVRSLEGKKNDFSMQALDTETALTFYRFAITEQKACTDDYFHLSSKKRGFG